MRQPVPDASAASQRRMTPPAGPIVWRDPFPLTSMHWWMGLASMLLMLLSQRFGNVAVAGCLAIWLGYAALAPARALQSVTSILLPWALPLLALTSLLWSVYLTMTGRQALELVTSTGVGIIMVRALSVRQFVSALAGAAVLSCLFSIASGHTDYQTGTGAVLSGLFGSKNQLAYIAALGAIACLGLGLSRSQPSLVRQGGLGGFCLCILALLRAHSAGALVALGPALGILCGFAYSQRLAPRWRGTVILAALLCSCVFAGIGFDFLAHFKASALTLLGKDATLTGRTVLWRFAEIAIARRPTLGTGYGAYWITTSPDALAVWTYAHETPGPGFHFHNLYYEATVELGFVGLFVIAVTMLSILCLPIKWEILHPSSESSVFASIAVFYLLRSPLEMDFIFPFGIGTLILPALYIYPLAGSHGRFTQIWQRQAWRRWPQRSKPVQGRQPNGQDALGGARLSSFRP